MIKARGFTLIEILIALAVFAILASLTASAMYYAFNTRSRVNQQLDRIAQLDLAFLLLNRDLRQLATRPVRKTNMQVAPAFLGQTKLLEFTRAGFANPNSEEKRAGIAGLFRTKSFSSHPHSPRQ